ncbi:MAG: type II toxin-antitoxin system HicA family toxin, partial [Armatimonadota bacterium]
MPPRRLRLREVEHRLRAAGYELVRQTGSHRVWRRDSAEGRRSAVVPNEPVIAVGTLAHILRQIGMAWEEFEA